MKELSIQDIKLVINEDGTCEIKLHAGLGHWFRVRAVAKSVDVALICEKIKTTK
jgi:hypothetical protein